jgi:hypothetical protein
MFDYLSINFSSESISSKIKVSLVSCIKKIDKNTDLSSVFIDQGIAFEALL